MEKMIKFWHQFKNNKIGLAVVTILYQISLCLLVCFFLYVFIIPLVGGWMLREDSSRKIEQCIANGIPKEECYNRYDW